MLLGDVDLDVALLVDLTALDHAVLTPDPLRGRVQGLGAVEHQEHGTARVQAPRLQVLQQGHTDRGVLGGALAQAKDALGAVGGDPRRHDHRLARVLDAIDHVFWPARVAVPRWWPYRVWVRWG